jgi:hypothetical protein
MIKQYLCGVFFDTWARYMGRVDPILYTNNLTQLLYSQTKTQKGWTLWSHIFLSMKSAKSLVLAAWMGYMNVPQPLVWVSLLVSIDIASAFCFIVIYTYCTSSSLIRNLYHLPTIHLPLTYEGGSWIKRDCR